MLEVIAKPVCVIRGLVIVLFCMGVFSLFWLKVCEGKTKKWLMRHINPIECHSNENTNQQTNY